MRPPDPGLCGLCRHARVIRSGRGSTFHFCERSRDQPDRFPRYPPLPVLRCVGFERNDHPLTPSIEEIEPS